MINSNYLNSTTLLHGVYRSLLNTGRTYAAFRDEQLSPLVEALREHGEILDPMSGYGSLMRCSSRSDHALRSYNIECNPPAYFWQLLVHPEHSTKVEDLAKIVLSAKRRWPRVRSNVGMSESWFPVKSLVLLEKLWVLCLDATATVFSRPHQMSMAFLLPFVGRLGSFVQGNVVTQIKPGGICVYSGWKEDFQKYIAALRGYLSETTRLCKQKKHSVILADARTWRARRKQFSAMITSPPYPNGRDYSKMFALENAFIEWMVSRRHIDAVALKPRLIGCSTVSEKGGFKKRSPEDIKSFPAREFLTFLQNYDKSKRAVEDNRVYYIPYYSNYFYDLEKAYENIAACLSSTFEGYLVAVNNTARKRIIPVAETVVEIWHNLGFNARIENTEELSHVGGMNPRVKGISSRHMEYTIKVCR